MFQTVIVDQLPKSSTSMSLLAMYISTLVGISTATVASSIICSLFISLRPSCFEIPLSLEKVIRQLCTIESGSNIQIPNSVLNTNQWLRNPRKSLRRTSLNSNFDLRDLSSTTAVVDEPHSYGDDHLYIKKKGSLRKPSNDFIHSQMRRQSRRMSHVFTFSEHAEALTKSSSNPLPKASSTSHLGATSGIDLSLTKHINPMLSHISKYQRRPIIIIIDWCRLSHIINAFMFTLCMILDVLVPMVLFIVMPPVKPPQL